MFTFLKQPVIYILTFLILIKYCQSSKVVLNGTDIIVKCPPAEEFIRTHMAPDFETPQLIRRLDWYYEDLLIASYQQTTLMDLNKQWWVSGMRYELMKPFYELKVQPTLPEDSGNYRCRLEADPLFAQDIMSHVTPLIVMVKPPSPSKPQITSYSERNVTLTWTHTVAKAHLPILKYSILISQLEADNIEVILTRNNISTITINNLKPYTRYAFSVRAENAAGHSNFGQEIVFRTMGEAPKIAPKIVSIVNGSDRCVDVKWENQNKSNLEVSGYRIMVHRLGSGDMREWYFKTTSNSLCSLGYHQDYRLSIEADNGFGYSPSVTQIFKTDIGVPTSPPQITSILSSSSTSVTFAWKEPKEPNGPINYFYVYYYPIKNPSQITKLQLKFNHEDHAKGYVHNITKLSSNTAYKIEMTAQTEKGESIKSNSVEVTTDYAIPASPTIVNITLECPSEAVKFVWLSTYGSLDVFYRVYVDLEKDIYPTNAGVFDPKLSLKESFNTTETSILIEGLKREMEYLVYVTSYIKSATNKNAFLESEQSKVEVFLLRKNCVLATSMCFKNQLNCETLENNNTEKRAAKMTLSYPLHIICMILVLTSIVFIIGAYLFKQHCLVAKSYLKKGENTNNYETIALVYDEKYGESIASGMFEKYCKSLQANDNALYTEQFEELSKESEKMEVEGTSNSCEDFQQKNRYLNIGAYEGTRIKLSANNTSDYINANYIDSCENKKAYIATQAPLPNTFGDFWSMVWQEKCNAIVCITKMVEKGRRKCDQYWPSDKKIPEVINGFTLTLTSEISNAYFVHRIITLKSSKCMLPERTVHHVQFTAWPDHGVPDNVFPLLSFMNYVTALESNGPLIVHCSAGVGRSGSYILIDSIRKHLSKSDYVKIQAHLRHMRKQRGKLVQTLEQYIFCHEVIKQLIKNGNTRMPTKQIMNYVQYLVESKDQGRSGIQAQYEDVCKCNHIIPCYFPIGCTILPGYHRIDEFIIAHYPAETHQLWDNVCTNHCQTVVCLCTYDEYVKFWSASPNVSSYYSEDLSSTRYITKRIEDHSVLIRSNESEDELVVRIFQVDPEGFEMEVWETIECIQSQLLQYHKNNTMLLVPKYDNIKTAFKFCALTSIGCQIEHEAHTDVLQYLSSYHLISCNCWSKQSDMEFIYDKTLDLVQLQKAR